MAFEFINIQMKINVNLLLDYSNEINFPNITSILNFFKPFSKYE